MRTFFDSKKDFLSIQLRFYFKEFVLHSLNVRTPKRETLRNGWVHDIRNFLMIATLPIEPNIKGFPFLEDTDALHKSFGHLRIDHVCMSWQAAYMLTNILFWKICAAGIFFHFQGYASHPKKRFVSIVHKVISAQILFFKERTKLGIILKDGPNFVMSLGQFIPKRDVTDPARKFTTASFRILKTLAQEILHMPHIFALKDKFFVNALSIKGFKEQWLFKLRGPVFFKRIFAIFSTFEINDMRLRKRSTLHLQNLFLCFNLFQPHTIDKEMEQWTLVATGLVSASAAFATAKLSQMQRDSVHERAIHNCATFAKNQIGAEIEFVRCLQIELGKPILHD